MALVCNRISLGHVYGTSSCPLCHPERYFAEPCPKCGEAHDTDLYCPKNPD